MNSSILFLVRDFNQIIHEIEALATLSELHDYHLISRACLEALVKLNLYKYGKSLSERRQSDALLLSRLGHVYQRLGQCSDADRLFAFVDAIHSKETINQESFLLSILYKQLRKDKYSTISACHDGLVEGPQIFHANDNDIYLPALKAFVLSKLAFCEVFDDCN